MIINVVLLVVAIGLVVKAADWFLSAAEKIGVWLRLPPFILGVILVGFGTSLPELATSFAATLDGVNNIAVANIYGSNIANILVIVGISTILLGTIKFDKDLIDLDMPLLLGISALFMLMSIDGHLSRLDGFTLLMGFVGYIIYSLGYKEDKAHHKGLISLISSLANRSKTKVVRGTEMVSPWTVFALVGSVGLLGLASKVAVDSLLNISEYVSVGASVLSFFALAIGTSLPELIVSMKSLRAGKGDIVLGNIIGSSMFNILLIGGTTSLVQPQVIDSRVLPWFLVGMGLSVLLLMAGSISRRIHIWEGFIYLLIYATLAVKVIG